MDTNKNTELYSLLYEMSKTISMHTIEVTVSTVTFSIV